MDVTQATFEQSVLERSKEIPVVVDFWAEWCGPCHALAPVLEREVAGRAGEVELVKVDVDSNQELAREYGVQGIPAVKGFRNGRVAAEFVGAQGAAAVSNFLDTLLAAPKLDGVLEQLRGSGELPEVVEALDAGEPERALGLILDSVAEASAADRDRLRDLAVAIFEELGPDDPRTLSYRRRLATALY